MSKEILFGADFKKIITGINKASKAVASTMGSKGRPVLICENGLQVVSKDGYTVAKSISLADKIENQGAVLVRDLTTKSVADAGDGSTCTTVLLNEIINLGIKNIEAGANAIDIKKGIELATKCVVEQLQKMSIPVGNDNEKIRQIATVSANGEKEIGDLIAKGFSIIGSGGDILIEESRSTETTIRVDVGYIFERGLTSPFWFTDPNKGICELHNPLIILVDGKLESLTEIVSLMQQIVKAQIKDVLIIADEVTGVLMDTMIQNKLRGILNVAIVHSPSYGERRGQMMEDLAILTNGKYFSPINGIKLEDAKITDCGTCLKVIIDKNKTTILQGAGSKESVAKRSQHIDALISQSESDIEIQMLKIRQGKLNGTFAVLSVGGATELEMKERKDRVEDAIRATKCAIEEGIVAGGGTALIRCMNALKDLETYSADENTGVRILAQSLTSPLCQIANNAGKVGEIYIEKVREQVGDYGYNANTDDIEDLVESGIIDATKVIRVALENAVSLANMVLISGCAIVEVG